MATPAAEIEITADLVGALLQEQHPHLAELPLERFASGWDNDLFRLGDELTVRLPRRLMAAVLVLHEQRWLPELGPHLPLPVPVPVAVGGPSEALGYPYSWTVGPWFTGVPLHHAPPDDLTATAEALGTFLAALHRPAPPEAPANPYRGVPLAERADRFEVSLHDLTDGIVDKSDARRLWEELAATPTDPGPPLWLHGDVHPLNLLVHHGRLSAVIDFGDITAGDRASDLAGAFTFLDRGDREVFRLAAGSQAPIDDDTWARARGWALALGAAMANGDDRVAEFGRRTLLAAVHDT
ncbi:MAG: aminoglycoside phosphotransferase family protein [Acidimicrobiales bacterium]